MSHGGRKKSKERSISLDKQRKRSRFIAADLIRDVKTGKLPFKNDNERIAKYGQGFAHMLQLVPQPRHQNYSQKPVKTTTQLEESEMKTTSINSPP